MITEFKFRIWDKQSKEFVYRGFSLTPNAKLLKFNQEVPNDSNFIVQFYTGMKDKYDKELFEEDIVEHTVASGGKITTHVGLVVYSAEKASYCLGEDPLNSLFSLRKLGNPYENPVLYNLYFNKQS
jgi:hypothetical protein